MRTYISSQLAELKLSYKQFVRDVGREHQTIELVGGDHLSHVNTLQMRFRPRSKNILRLKPRNARGFQLVECLIAVVLASIVMSAVLPDLFQMMRFGVDGRSQMIASDVCQEVIDNARNMTWSDLTAAAGSHTLVVNAAAGSSISDTFFPRALQLDMRNLVYSSQAQQNLFHADSGSGGLVTCTITNNGNNTCTVQVTVQWLQATGSRTMTVSTEISEYGIHV